jgi:AraC-like DNA-binding protein
MLSEVEARLVVPDTADDPLLRARQILDDAPQHPWSLTELACHVGLSPAYLCRRFAARFGEPPMAWVGRRRLDAALALRQAGRLPRREIAAAAGYADPDSLNRALRRRGRHGHCG